MKLNFYKLSWSFEHSAKIKSLSANKSNYFHGCMGGKLSLRKGVVFMHDKT